MGAAGQAGCLVRLSADSGWPTPPAFVRHAVEGRTVCDCFLPFDLRSAPRIFTAVTDALQWVMVDSGISMVEHYLDDFGTLGSPWSSECGRHWKSILAVCTHLGISLAMDKLKGPTDCLTFLGIELDTSVCHGCPHHSQFTLWCCQLPVVNLVAVLVAGV